MRVKFLLEDLNPGPYSLHFTSIYTYGVTIAPRVCDGKFSFLNIHVLQLALRVLHKPNLATKNSNPCQEITNKNKMKKIKLNTNSKFSSCSSQIQEATKPISSKSQIQIQQPNQIFIKSQKTKNKSKKQTHKHSN